MNHLKLFGLALIATLALTLSASEKSVYPIGYFVDSIPVSDADPSATHAKVTRAGETVDVTEGMEAFPGDVVNTPDNGGILVAFLDNTTIQLRASSQVTLDGGNSLQDVQNELQSDVTRFTVNLGNVGVVTHSSNENNAPIIQIGEAHNLMARAAAPKPSAMEIVVTSNGSGGYTSHVVVTAGSALLTPTGAQTVTLADGAAGHLAILNLNTASVNAPNGGGPVTLTIDPNAKTDLAGLKGSKTDPTYFEDTIVKVGKAGSNTVTFTSTIRNPDGSVATGKFTTISGNVTADSWKTANKATKFSESWAEGKGKIAVKNSYVSGSTTVSFSASLVGNTTAKATVKVGKDSYTGTATYNPVTGVITFTTTKSPKDGSTVAYTFNPAGGSNNTAVVTGGTGGTFSFTSPTGAPNATTPDGRFVTQNQPPVSQ